MENTTIKQFIEDNGITMTACRIDGRPDQNRTSAKKRDQWGTSHWCCTFYRGGMGTGKGSLQAEMSVLYSQGAAHKTKPRTEDVLDNLASDVQGYESARHYGDWAGDLGYELDSREGKAIYDNIGELYEELQCFLGRDAFRQLLATERL